MQPYQSRFLEYSIRRGALRFGEFQLKSGRISPYFFNASVFNTGADLTMLANCYAGAIQQADVTFDLLFGPAYKGIPLAAITAGTLFQQYQRDIAYAFDRKEIKHHGEGGKTVGAPVEGRVMLIDDVITAGTAIRNTKQLIESLGATVNSIVVAVDREEKGQQELSAIQELEQLGLQVIAIIGLTDILQFLKLNNQVGHLEAVKAYRDRYGID